MNQLLPLTPLTGIQLMLMNNFLKTLVIAIVQVAAAEAREIVKVLEKA
jgi:hypothetical protein